MDKKTLVGIITILAIFIVGFLVYFFYITLNNKIQKISDQKLLVPVLDQKGENIFYFFNQSNPGFYSFSLSTKQANQISKFDETPSDMIWSPEKNMVIFKVVYSVYTMEKYSSIFQNPGSNDGDILYWTYEIKTSKINPLDKNIKQVTWSADGKKIIYIFNNSGKYSLNQSDPDGQNWQKLVDLDKEFTGLKVSPDGKKVALSPQLTIYDIVTKKLSPTQISNVLDIQWSPDSQQIVVFTSDKTQVYNIAKNQAAALKEKIDSNKFIWLSNAEVVVAKSGKYGDEIYKLNITTQKTKSLFKSIKKQPVEVESFLLSPDAKKLYLVNKKDYYLYEITLGK